jgi:molybdenum cofactor cytidylyltransferase
MIFGPTPLDEAEGAILAHTIRLPGKAIKKGTVLDAAAIAALREAGRREVIAARLAQGDVPEDEAASRIADALLGPLIARSRAATGRVNLLAESAGLLVLDTGLIDRVNALDESLTVATLANFSRVQPKEMLATIKVIPFAAPADVLRVAEAMLRGRGAVAIHPFRPLKVGLVMTELPGVKESAMEGAVEVTQARVEALMGTLLPVERVPHETRAVADALDRLGRQGAACCWWPAPPRWWTGRMSGRPASCARAGGSSISACRWTRAT